MLGTGFKRNRRIIAFRQEAKLNKYFDLYTGMRKKAWNEIGTIWFKWMVNAFYNQIVWRILGRDAALHSIRNSTGGVERGKLSQNPISQKTFNLLNL